MAKTDRVCRQQVPRASTRLRNIAVLLGALALLSFLEIIVEDSNRRSIRQSNTAGTPREASFLIDAGNAANQLILNNSEIQNITKNGYRERKFPLIVHLGEQIRKRGQQQAPTVKSIGPDERQHDNFLRVNFRGVPATRRIAFDDDKRLREEKSALLLEMDEYLDEYFYRFDERTYPRDCIRPSWTDRQYPNCNAFHEITLDMVDCPLNVSYLGHGFYRDSFLFQNSHENFVMKNLRIQQQFHFRRSEQMRTEALLLEKFSTSPRFTAIYGYCDTSLLVETAREFTDQVVPFDSPRQAERGRISRTDLAKLESDHSIYSFNNFTAEQKLDMASQIAEALAEFHGSESVIVHDDFDPDNFLITDSRQLKMNDMNNAIFLEWNPVKNQYCKIFGIYKGKNYFMDSQKYKGSYVDESVDIPPMGYMIFILLAGLWPYYDFPENQFYVVQELAAKGFMPRISPSFKRRSLIESRLVELMYKCIDPVVVRRPDAFEIVRFLRETRTMHENEVRSVESNFSTQKGRTLVRDNRTL